MFLQQLSITLYSSPKVTVENGDNGFSFEASVTR